MAATITCVRPGAARAAVALVLAGLAGGALAPTLAAAGAWAPPTALAALLALAAWLARGGDGPLLPRAALAAGGGALAGLLLAGPAGLAHLAFGLALGLALQRQDRRGLGLPRQVADALPVAAGALLGGVLAGALPVAALPPEAAAALLAGAVALGVALGDATRDVVLVRDAPPAWVAALVRQVELDDERAHALLVAAVDAHRGAVRALDEAGLDRDATRESALLSRDLLSASACAAREAWRMHRAGAALRASAGPGLDHAELAAAQARIGASLEGRRAAALDEGARHAAALGRLAAALVERGGRGPAGSGRGAPRERAPDAVALERRVDALARRVDVGGAA